MRENRLTNLGATNMSTGNILLAQANSTRGTSSSAGYFLLQKQFYLADAANRVIRENLNYFRNNRFVELGNSSKFTALARSVHDVLSLNEYPDNDAQNNTLAIAYKIKIPLMAPRIFIYLKHYDAIGSNFDYSELNKNEIDLVIWHELIHVFEFTNPQLDSQYRQYDTYPDFVERHAEFYDNIIQNWNPISERIDNGLISLIRAKDVLIRQYKRSYDAFWKGWLESDAQNDMNTIHRELGIKIHIENVKNINEDTESLLKRKHMYLLGHYRENDSNCVNFASVNDYSETSDIPTTKHTKKIQIAGNNHNLTETEIYITPDYFSSISNLSTNLIFCIDRRIHVQR